MCLLILFTGEALYQIFSATLYRGAILDLGSTKSIFWMLPVWSEGIWIPRVINQSLILTLNFRAFCEPCDLRFPTNLILDRHNVKVHKYGKSLDIQCTYCNKSFPRYQHLVAHSNR